VQHIERTDQLFITRMMLVDKRVTRDEEQLIHGD